MSRRPRRYGRRYCKRHGLEYVPLYNPPPAMADVRARAEANRMKRAQRQNWAEQQRILREQAQVAAFFGGS